MTALILADEEILRVEYPDGYGNEVDRNGWRGRGEADNRQPQGRPAEDAGRRVVERPDGRANDRQAEELETAFSDRWSW
jgi:hypothetical protein